MDEELEQRGLTPKSFFNQSTETREMAQAAQKTSNSNLTLLKELKEKVEIISNDLQFLKNEAKDRAFEEEDRKQKEEMEAKVKEQNEKAQGTVLGDKGGVKEPEKKGLMGQVGSFLSNLIGGLVGGAVGFTLSGIGGLIGGTVNLGKKALDLGKSLKEKLFGKKKDKKKKGGKVKVDKFLGVVEEEDNEKKKENDKELIKSEIKQELGLGERLKETGGKILGGIKKTLGGIKDTISNFDGRPGSRKTKLVEKKSENEEIKEFNEEANKIKEEAAIAKETGKTDISTELKEQASGGNKELANVEIGKKTEKKSNYFDTYVGSDGNTYIEGNRRKIAMFNRSKDRGARSRLLNSINSRRQTAGLPQFNPYALGLDISEFKILNLNEGGVVQKFNQGGEVDSVPAMLTPGEFVVTKDAVQKVGVDTLKGLNASVGATNKPTLMKGTTDSFLGSMSMEFGGFNEDGSINTIEKTMRMTHEGLEKTYFDDKTDIYELTGDDEYFHEKNEMIGAGMSSETIERYNIDETFDDGSRDTLTGESRKKSMMVAIGVPDLIAHRNQLMSEINKLEGFEKVTFDQFMRKEHGIPQELLLPILYRSDASKATRKKMDRAKKLDKEQGVKPASAYMNPVVLGYRQNQINPTQYVSSKDQLTERDVSTYKYDATKDPTLAKGFNQGGLVTPIIESKNRREDLISNLSQLVEKNSQNIQVIQAQNQAMNPPNSNPQTTVPAQPPNTTLTDLQDTDAPIPFATLLRQSAQRYLNLGNNAMVIS